MKRFWNFIRDENGGRILRLEGPIDEDNFWGDEVTPKAFRDELEADEGDVTVYINSPGGNVFAAAEIYTMLIEHKGRVTVKIDAIAASAASVIAMAGDTVLMSPVAMLMLHDPMTVAMGNAKDMEKAISTLNEVKESIINAYQKKTGLSRNKISQLMENETWMNARKAVELGFADEILFAKKQEPETTETEEEKDDGKEIEAVWQPYSTRVMGQTMLNRLGCTAEAPAPADEEPVEDTCDTQDVEPAPAGLTKQLDMFDGSAGETVGEDTETETPVTGKAKQKPGGGKAEAAEEDPQEEEPEDEDPDEEDPSGDEPDEDEDPDEDDHKPESAKAECEPAPVMESAPPKPLIGMDGKTEDGAMPYELLKKQLEFLK